MNQQAELRETSARKSRADSAVLQLASESSRRTVSGIGRAISLKYCTDKCLPLTLNFFTTILLSPHFVPCRFHVFCPGKEDFKMLHARMGKVAA